MTVALQAPSGLGGQVVTSNGNAYTVSAIGVVIVQNNDVGPLLNAGFTMIPALTDALYGTAALQSAVIPAAKLAGAHIVCFENTGTTPGNLQLDTVANCAALLPGPIYPSAYMLLVRNSAGGANTATITTNTGWTLSGTMTIAQNVTRAFVVDMASAAAWTLRSMGLFAAGA